MRILLGIIFGAISSGLAMGVAAVVINHYSSDLFFGNKAYMLAAAVGVIFGFIVGGISSGFIAGFQLGFLKAVLFGFVFSILVDIFLLFHTGGDILRNRQYAPFLVVVIITGILCGGFVSLISVGQKTIE